jgi:hypothetical protein
MLEEGQAISEINASSRRIPHVKLRFSERIAAISQIGNISADQKSTNGFSDADKSSFFPRFFEFDVSIHLI